MFSYQDYLYIENQKALRRIEIANQLNAKGIQKWLIDYAMTNSVQLANLLNFIGEPSGRAQKTAFLCIARDFIPLIGKSEEMRGQDDANRLVEYTNLYVLNRLIRIDVANELNAKGVPTELAVATIGILDPIQYANRLNSFGMDGERANELAIEVQILEFQYNPKHIFGRERSSWGQFFSNVGRVFEVHHWKITQEIARPLTKDPVKKINQEFENAIQDVQNQRAKYLQEVDIAAANQRNLLQWQYGKGLSDDQTYQMNYVATYAPLDEMRIQLIVINLNDANNISIVLGNMQYEKSQHDIRLLNWKHSFELAEADIQLNAQKKKNEINHRCDKYAYQLSHEQYHRIEKLRRNGAKKLIVIAAASFIAPQIGQYLSATVSSSLGITSATAQSALTGALTGMAFSGVTGILSGDTKHLAQNMFKAGVMGGIGAYVGKYSEAVEVLKQSNTLRTIFVAGVKATAGSLINHDKLGQGLVTQICQGLLLGESADVPKGFLDVLQDAMLRAATSSFVDTLMHGGPLGDKLAASGTMAFFQSLGEYAGKNFFNWFLEELREWELAKEAEQELDKPNITPIKALKNIENENNPKRLLLQHNAMAKKAKKLSDEGKQIESANYSNAADVTKERYRLIVRHMKENYFDRLEEIKPPTKEENPSWWKMFKRSISGDNSPDVLEWKQNLRNQKYMQYIAAVCDGARQGTEIGAPIREVGLAILGGGIGAVGVNAVAKGAGRLLFSYKVYRQAEKQAENIMKNGSTDRIQHEALKTIYRQKMENPSPAIKDQELLDGINALYRPGAKLGNKCSSDATRYELHTLKEVEGKSHIQKCQDTARFLEKWLENNQTAHPGDRSIAENVLLELKDALGEKPWYSQTKPPKY